MKEFLQFVAQQLVNKPSEVDVREIMRYDLNV